MGWSGGSEVARKMIHSINDNISSPRTKRVIYRDLIECLTDEDWDSIEEACDIDSEFDDVAQKYMDEE